MPQPHSCWSRPHFLSESLWMADSTGCLSWGPHSRDDPPNSNSLRIPGRLGSRPCAHAPGHPQAHTGHPRAFSSTRNENVEEEEIPPLGKRKDQNQAWTAGLAQDSPTQNVTPPEICHYPHVQETQKKDKYETQINPTARCLFSPGRFPVYVTREGWKGLKDRLVRRLKAAVSAVTQKAPSRYQPGPLP